MATTRHGQRRVRHGQPEGEVERARDGRRDGRASKASDSSLFEYLGNAWSGSAIDETDASSTLESSRQSLTSAPLNPQLLPDSFRHTPAESKRLSISSFVSALSNRGYSWSGRSSVAGSEPEGAYVMRLDRLARHLFLKTCHGRSQSPLTHY
jgi:hypothetical protein